MDAGLQPEELRMTASNKLPTRNRVCSGGRPKCGVSSAEVLKLRNEGHSWRQIAKALGIGTATAIRLWKLSTVPNVSQNPGGGD